MSQQDEYLLQIERILQKLEQARSRQLTCYGSDSHGFRLNSPMSEAQIQAFEAREQIRLPEDYRLFLTHAGNGGAGPYNGIFPLNQWDDFADWVLDERPEHFLVLPCPLYQWMPRTEDWDEDFTDDSPYASPYQGTLSLGSQGCTYAMQLIVTGDYRGRVVYVDADDSPPYVVHEPNFLSWYERWLDELLQGYTFGWFGYGPGGGEADFLRILSDPQANDDFRAEAALAFYRLPELSDNAAPHLAEYLNDPVAGVRSGVVSAIRRFRLNRFLDQVEQLIEDPSAEVRENAVRTVMTFDTQRYAQAVIRRLREDSDEDVVRAAFSVLEDAKALTKAELLYIMQDPIRGNLRGQVARMIEWDEEDEPLLVRLLTDSDIYVRSCAMTALKQIKGRNVLPYLLEMLRREQDVNIVGHILKALGEFGEPSTVPVLLEWVESADDFHRLEAMESLAKIGDERVSKSAQAMLQENRKPVRRDADSLGGMSHVRTISELVRQSLAASPNQNLRQLAN